MSSPASDPAPSPQGAALRFLAERIDYERTQSMPCSEEAFKLDRMRELLCRLGNPQRDMPIVHIAGTKGKGSTAAMMAAVLSAAGYRTGLFTSPHLDRVEERIAVDGQPCSTEEFAALIELIRPAVESLDREKGTSPICVQQPAGGHRPKVGHGKLDLSPFPAGPTYFEIITAAALCHFARRQVDAAVLEVGLGGRLDSTNVCTPCLSIITSISFDHAKQLGDSLAAIAAEKAGIIKPGVTVISGVTAQQPRDVVRQIARRSGCRLLELGADFDFDYRPPRHLEQAASPPHLDFRWLAPAIESHSSAKTKKNRRRLTASGEVKASEDTFRRLLASGYFVDVKDIALGLLGRHQAANAALVLAASGELCSAGWTIPEAAIRKGLAEVLWPARVEVLGRRPTVVLDAAHNAASIEALVKVLAESFSARRRLLVFATTRDKDLRGMLASLLDHFDDVIFTQYQENPRGVPPEELQALAADLQLVRLPENSCRREKPPHCNGGAFGGGKNFVNDELAVSARGLRASVAQVAPTPTDAWNAIQRLVTADDLVCITGSFFIAAEMRRQITVRPLSQS